MKSDWFWSTSFILFNWDHKLELYPVTGELKNTAAHTQSRTMKKSCLCPQDVLNSLKNTSELISAPSLSYQDSFTPQKRYRSVCLVHGLPRKHSALHILCCEREGYRLHTSLPFHVLFFLFYYYLTVKSAKAPALQKVTDSYIFVSSENTQ